MSGVWPAAFGLHLAILLAAARSEAAVPAIHEAEVAKCIRIAAQGRSWLEITLWGLRDQEGGRAGTVALNRNGSHDLGPMQINSWWVPRLAEKTGAAPVDVRRWLTSDICYNVEAARWIFISALNTTGDYWSAIGAYHSPSPGKAERYARSVAHKLHQRFGSVIFRARSIYAPVRKQTVTNERGSEENMPRSRDLVSR